MNKNLNITAPNTALIAIALFAVWGIGGQTEARADTCKPSDGQVALFIGENFSGDCVIKGLGQHASITTDAGRPGMSLGADVPHISSVKVGPGVEALACEQPRLRGACILVYYDEASLSSRRAGRRGITFATSFWVRRENEVHMCQPSSDQVAVWSYPYFFGDCYLGDTNDTYWRTDPAGVRALRVGANVKLVTCKEVGQACVVTTPGWYSNWTWNLRSTPVVPGERLKFRVFARHAPTERREQGVGSTEEAEPHTYRLPLRPQPVFEDEDGIGHPWWYGVYPLTDRDQGTLLGVKDVMLANQPDERKWVGLLKPNYTPASCDDSNAQVILRHNQAMTEQDMIDVFGSASPAFPVTFTACSGLHGTSGPNGLVFPAVDLELTFTTE